jgi:glucosamine 6-phosphate synthetase-like amidotransferase/phosphosugar isomerase protein
MCGIFGVVAKSKISQRDLKKLVNHSQQRGKDSSGFIFLKDNTYNIYRADFKASLLFNEIKENKSKLVFGHSRLITNGLSDNQPIIKNNIILLHNGIIVNEDEVWDQISIKRELVIDSETIIAIAEDHFNNNGKLENLPDVIFNKCGTNIFFKCRNIWKKRFFYRNII